MSDPQVYLPESRNIDGYIIKELLLGGENTSFFRVEDRAGQAYALKVPNASAVRSPKLRARFDREAHILYRLRAPQFPALISQGLYNTRHMADIPYLVTEMPRGYPLSRLMHPPTGKPDVKRAIRILANLAEALHILHSQDIIHRNLKPLRICVTDEGAVQIVEFVVGRTKGDPVITEGRNLDELLGTVTYVAPEQALNPRAVDHRADLYALGVIVYELVTFRNPFVPPGSDPLQRMKRLHEEASLASAFNAEVPVELDIVLSTLLKPDPEQRYATAESLLGHLEALGLIKARKVSTLSSTPSIESARNTESDEIPLDEIILNSGYELVVKGRSYPLQRVAVMLTREGYDGPAVLVVPESTISVDHALLCWLPDEQAYRIIERPGVTNPMRCRGVDIHNLRLRPGVTIEVGNMTLTIKVSSSTSGVLSRLMGTRQAVNSGGLVVKVRPNNGAPPVYRLMNQPTYALRDLAGVGSGEVVWIRDLNQYAWRHEGRALLASPGTSFSIEGTTISFFELDRKLMEANLKPLLNRLTANVQS